ncbi:MAG: type II toxin-antitoxin system HicB family antitoxin [Rubrobacteraceae bacterium]
MMDNPRYEIDIFWSEEDDAFVANVPELTYCSAWGETCEEALREVLVAIDLHLQTVREDGLVASRDGPRRHMGGVPSHNGGARDVSWWAKSPEHSSALRIRNRIRGTGLHARGGDGRGDHPRHPRLPRRNR